MEMLDLSAASISQTSCVTMDTPASCATSRPTSQQDNVLYEQVTTHVDYEQCHSHYSSLSNTNHQQYEILQPIMPSTTSDQYMAPFNNSNVTEQNKQSITSRCHAESAPAIDEDYLTVLSNDCNAKTPVWALLIRKLNAVLGALNYNSSRIVVRLTNRHNTVSWSHYVKLYCS